MDCAHREEGTVRIASIDIGTNTVLLLVADVNATGTIETVHHEQRLPRLGKDVDQQKRILIPAFDRVAWILNEYKNLALQLRSEKIIACATSAVRDAINGDEFIAYLKQTTGIDVEIISGDEEAALTYKGATGGSKNLVRQPTVIDVGGGSTELTYAKQGTRNGNRELHRYSLNIGSVRLTERYFKHDPPTPEEVASARQFVLEELSQVVNPGFSQFQLVGVAGTATTLACLDQQLIEFEVDRVSGYRIEIDRVAGWCKRLASMRRNEIRALSNVTEGRADILAAGVLILFECMKLFGFDSLLVSEKGLRYGIVLREWERVFK